MNQTLHQTKTPAPSRFGNIRLTKEAECKGGWPSAGELIYSTPPARLAGARAALLTAYDRARGECSKLLEQKTAVLETVKQAVETPLRPGQTLHQANLEQIALEEQLGMKDVCRAYDENEALVSHLNSLLSLTDRMQLRSEGLFPEIPERWLCVEARLGLHGRDPSSLAKLIRRHIGVSSVSLDRVYVRFFDAAREDLVRIFGTDRQGVSNPASDERDFGDWDKPHLETLSQRGLQAEDGLYCTEPESLDSNFTLYLKEMLKGRLSLAIYDRNALLPLKHDFACFYRPRQKQEALLGIISRNPNGL